MLVDYENGLGWPEALGPMGGFWLQISSALAVVATWGVSQQTEDPPLSFFVISDFPIETNNLKKKKYPVVTLMHP